MSKFVCVFCGSSTGTLPAFAEAAEAMGEALVRRGLGLVYGGASVGLMGIVAESVLSRGGEVVGVIPSALLAREVGALECTELIVVDSMHERKATMAARTTEGFVAMPGGFGTFEEILEVLTWAQLGFHALPCGFLDVAGYYRALLEHFDNAVASGFVASAHRNMVHAASDPDALLDAFAAHEPPPRPKWMAKSEA